MRCKWLSFAFLVLGLFGSAVQAQEIGITLGAQESNARSRTDGDSTSQNFGIHAGLTGSFQLEDSLKFRTGVIYMQRHFDLNTPNGNYTFNFDFIDVPALV